jgi:nucleoside-diphosphate-sugar epimerase
LISSILAAQVVVPFLWKILWKIAETNARGTLNVLEKAHKDDARLIFATAQPYGNQKFSRQRRIMDSILLLLRLIKVVGEEYPNMYASQYGQISLFSGLRMSGPRCHGVINDFFDKISRDQTSWR